MIHPRLNSKSYENLTKFLTLISLCIFLFACSTTPQVQDEIPEPPIVATEKAPTIVKKSPPKKKVVAKKKVVKKKVVAKKKTKVHTPKPTKVVSKKTKPKKLVKKTVVTKNKPKPQAPKKVILPVVEKQAEIEEIQQAELLFDLSSLPLQYGDTWFLDKENEGACTLRYAKLSMPDGQGETPVKLVILIDQLMIKTKSNIDMEYPNIGLRIDQNPQIPIESMYNEYSISYKSGYSAVIDEMKTGALAEVALGFWPTWPISQTYSAVFDLQDFSGAYDGLVKCSKQ